MLPLWTVYALAAVYVGATAALVWWGPGRGDAWVRSRLGALTGLEILRGRLGNWKVTNIDTVAWPRRLVVELLQLPFVLGLLGLWIGALAALVAAGVGLTAG